MRLNLEQIKQITTGAVRIEEGKDGFEFKRFTKAQEELYKERNEGVFLEKTYSTSGVKFSFKTNSQKLKMTIKTSPSSSRKYFSVDVFADGCPIGYIANFSQEDMILDYTKSEYFLGEFSKEFNLGEGEKAVDVHLPWSVNTRVMEISVDDGAFIKGQRYEKTLLAFGDSITHGYDAIRPSSKYVTKLCQRLCAQEFNKGIGGEMFFPDLAREKEPFVPDYITVAYGTNDWNNIAREEFLDNCRAFYEALSQNYPDTEIFAISPIWRKDAIEKRKFGSFETVEKYIEKLVRPIKNVTFISGYDLVPEDEKYFADLRLHPNDEGFMHYEKNLYSKILSALGQGK